jgi:predicted phosphoribosyltransferase
VRFRNRADAGRQLAAHLTEYEERFDVVVLALPRGGVPVAFEIAARLEVPLDVFVVRKIGVPGHSELAMGAVADGGVQVLNHSLIEELGIAAAAVEQAAARERVEVERRAELFRGMRPRRPVTGRTIILVDDGLATGATMEAAVLALRRLDAARIIVAAPVGPRDTCDRLRRLADRLLCLSMPEPFQAVGLWYDDFSQTSDQEVADLLAAAVHQHDHASQARASANEPGM